jgi:ADP-ribosylglycohydrolase
MAIAPVGIVNACRPQQAAQQAYRIASLIHVYDVGFCQDAAAAIAAAVAEAFKADATVESILDAAVTYLEPISGRMMKDLIGKAVNLARRYKDFKKFRSTVYEQADAFFLPITCDSRETAPLALALFSLSGGDFEKAVTYGANFGRDADTIACMLGGIAGALAGADGIKPAWRKKLRAYRGEEEQLAEGLARTAIQKDLSYRSGQESFEKLL